MGPRNQFQSKKITTSTTATTRRATTAASHLRARRILTFGSSQRKPIDLRHNNAGVGKKLPSLCCSSANERYAPPNPSPVGAASTHVPLAIPFRRPRRVQAGNRALPRTVILLKLLPLTRQAARGRP